jgi:phosphoribosylamine--glycine ligase
VLCAVGMGHSVRAAQLQAYELAGAVRFPGAHYRRDIGHRAAVREAAGSR